MFFLLSCQYFEQVKVIMKLNAVKTKRSINNGLITILISTKRSINNGLITILISY